MFQCKHRHKAKVNMDITDRVECVINGKEATYVIGKYQLYRCLECKCLVYEEIIEPHKTH